MLKTMMKNPLIAPARMPTASATTTASQIGMPWSAFNTATSIDAKVSTLAIDKSKSPAMSGRSSPRVVTASTACEPKIVERFAQVRKLPG